MLKRISICQIMLVVAAAVCLVGTDLSAANISFLKGSVDVISNNNKNKAVNGYKILAGDIVMTGNKSFAEISYQDGTKIKINQNSKVKIGSTTTNEDETISVIVGRVEGKFAKIKKDGSERRVYTPTTVCAVRGTEFAVTVTDGADSRVDMTEGSVDLRNPYGTTNVSGKDKAEINVGNKPENNNKLDSPESWLKSENSDLEKNPAEQGNQISNYMVTFDERSKTSSTQIKTLDATVKNKDAAADTKTGEQVNSTEQSVRDDLYLTEATGASIDTLLSKKGNDPKYESFQKAQSKFSIVADQQRRNYEAIMRIKQEYK